MKVVSRKNVLKKAIVMIGMMGTLAFLPIGSVHAGDSNNDSSTKTKTEQSTEKPKTDDKGSAEKNCPRGCSWSILKGCYRCPKL